MNEDVIMIVNGWENMQSEIGQMPHRKCSDMTLSYFSMVTAEENVINLRVIDAAEADKRGFKNEESLYQKAVENTRAFFPLKISSWNEDIYVISNEKNVFGATCIFYPGCLEKVSEMIGGDMYIIPSSIHEVLCVPADNADPEDLKRMLYDANNDVVPERDVLSYNIYSYDSKKDMVSAYASGEEVV